MTAPPDRLGPWLRERLGFALGRWCPVGGGCIHQAWCLEAAAGAGGPARRLFAKTAPPEQWPLLEVESDGLAALARAAEGSGLVVPEPLALGRVDALGVLVLPWLDLEGGSDWAALGVALARLHRRSVGRDLGDGDRPEAFGWRRDNVIGATPQANGWERDWALFFRRRRLEPQLALLARRGLSVPGAEELLERLPAWLAPHQPEPVLVHGDLWSGNAGLLAGGAGAVFDPAAHRADREVDLAMARLFGGFPQSFFDGYGREWPLPPDHGQRVDLYNLYHLLNHANLFGGGYVGQCRTAVAALLRQTPR